MRGEKCSLSVKYRSTYTGGLGDGADAMPATEKQVQPKSINVPETHLAPEIDTSGDGTASTIPSKVGAKC
jgi:hypothetical protein